MRNKFIIAVTFILAFILTILPMPEWTAWGRPAWILLVVLYWNISMPYQVSIGAAWFLGLLLDVLSGSLLGEHALAMTIASYFAVKMNARIKMFALLQQGICIFSLVLLYQFIIYCVQGFINELPKSKLYWLASLVSMLLWPWVAGTLRNIYRQFRIAS
jgi:rod shape-determining protein MreD